MSRNFYDKLLDGTGTSSKKVESAFGAKILAKFGWSEGSSLGLSTKGPAECVQIRKRKTDGGIGFSEYAKSAPSSTGEPASSGIGSQWEDNWSCKYNSIAKRMSEKLEAMQTKNRLKRGKKESDSEESESEAAEGTQCSESESDQSTESSTESSSEPRTLVSFRIKRARR